MHNEAFRGGHSRVHVVVVRESGTNDKITILFPPGEEVSAQKSTTG